MDKYIYDDKNGLWYDCKEITISLVLSYQPKKEQPTGLWGTAALAVSERIP